MYKILFITTHFDIANSSAAIRNNALVRGLKKNGCKVDVLTVKWPLHKLSNVFLSDHNWDKIYRTSLTEIELNSKINQKTSGSSFSGLHRMKKAVKIIFQFPDVCRSWSRKRLPGELLSNSYDVIISSSDLKSSHFKAIQVLKKVSNKPKWLQVWGDPWGDDINMPLFLKPLVFRLEERIISQAQAIVYVSDPTAVSQKNKFPFLREKMFYIPRGFYKTAMCENVNPTDKNMINVVYTGIINSYRNVENFVKVISNYNRKSIYMEIHLFICGHIDSNILLNLKRYDCVSVEEGLAYDEVLEKYLAASFLLFIGNSGQTTQIPGKLYDYMGTEKPILCLVDNLNDEVSCFLKKHERCFLIENTEEKIQENMDIIVNNARTKWNIESIYSPYNTALKLIEILKKI